MNNWGKKDRRKNKMRKSEEEDIKPERKKR